MRISVIAIALVLACSMPATAQQAATLTGPCTVTDPTPTPLNVRASPQGQIVSTLRNGTQVRFTHRAKDYKGQEWVYIVAEDGRGIGWVFFRYITCP